MSNKKYYWLRLKIDFFKRHDITIIESMPNGKDYVLFYLKLLLESVDHEGCLRFSDTIPYNDQMLSTITNTNVDIVRSALNVFSELHMIDILDDKTIYMTEVEKMIGSASQDDEARENNRLRQQKHRDKVRQELLECDNNVIRNVEIELEKELDKEIEKDNKQIRHKYGEYKNVLLSDEELEKLKDEFPDWKDRIERLSSYIASTGKKYKSHLATIRNWARNEKPKTDNNTIDWDSL